MTRIEISRAEAEDFTGHYQANPDGTYTWIEDTQ